MATLETLTQLHTLELVRAHPHLGLPLTLQNLKMSGLFATYHDYRQYTNMTLLDVKNLCMRFLPIGLQSLSFMFMTKQPENIVELTKLSEIHIVQSSGDEGPLKFAARILSLKKLHITFRGDIIGNRLDCFSTHRRLYSLHLTLVGETNLSCLASLTCLKQLGLAHCYQLINIHHLWMLSNLETLSIDKCPAIASYEVFCTCSCLQTVHIQMPIGSGYRLNAVREHCASVFRINQQGISLDLQRRSAKRKDLGND
jgi:hypothetical protein